MGEPCCHSSLEKIDVILQHQLEVVVQFCRLLYYYF